VISDDGMSGGLLMSMAPPVGGGTGNDAAPTLPPGSVILVRTPETGEEFPGGGGATSA
jgi:hypothetical protein